MTSEIENNVLILLFLGGWKQEPYYVIERPFFKKLGGCIFSPSELKFDTDWNWLKEAIDYCIETIGVKTIDECTEVEWLVTTNITKMYIGVSIEQAYHYVIEYIKWYNENNK